jgi:hypothetical protein
MGEVLATARVIASVTGVVITMVAVMDIGSVASALPVVMVLTWFVAVALEIKLAMGVVMVMLLIPTT